MDRMEGERVQELEKVIKGLEHCKRESESIDDNPCNGCPYNYDGERGENVCLREQLMRDALELLKKQAPKPVWYETNSMTGLPICHCPSCNEVIKPYAYGDIRKAYYCQYCGQAVKWE